MEIKLVNKILDKILPPSSPNSIFSPLTVNLVLDECERIQLCLAAARKRREGLNQQYKLESEIINKEISSIREACKHIVTTYHSDPCESGWHECDICGEEIGKYVRGDRY